MNLIFLDRDNFLPRFFRLAVVNILSNIIIPLAGLITIAFLGHLTDIRHLAGVGVATVLFNYVYRLLNFLRMGTTGITAQALGQGDRETMLLVGMRNGLIALALGVAILLLQYPLQELWFTLLSAAPEVKASGQAYFNARIWGAPAVALNLVIVGWLLGQEMSGKVLVMTIIGNTANIVLDYFYIVRWDWGSVGAGLSTCLSQYLILVLGILFVSSKIQLTEVQTIAEKFWNLPKFKAIFTLNKDIFIRILANRTTVVIFMNLSAAIGTVTLASNIMMIEIVILTISFIEGVGFAAETLTGNFKGSGKEEKLAPLAAIAIGTSLLIGLSFALTTIAFPQTIFTWLTNHTEVTDEINIYLLWLLPVLGLISIAFMLDGYFLGLSDALTSRNSSLIGISVGFLPVAILAWYTHSNHILWLAFSVFMLIRSSIVVHKLFKTVPVIELFEYRP